MASPSTTDLREQLGLLTAAQEAVSKLLPAHSPVSRQELQFSVDALRLPSSITGLDEQLAALDQRRAELGAQRDELVNRYVTKLRRFERTLLQAVTTT